MKAIIFILLNSFFLQVLYAQNVNFAWAKQMGGKGDFGGSAIIVDATGNVYTTGGFRDTVDIDPGIAVFDLSSAGSFDIFVSKLDASGNFMWAKRMGGMGEDISTSIALDPNGNIYTTGWFTGSVDFDPGPGTYNLTSITWGDFFVSKLDASGNFIWAKQFGQRAADCGNYIASDVNGNVYLNGNFTGTADFDPSPAVFNLTTNIPPLVDIFVSKLDAAGNFLWAKRVGGVDIDESFSIAIDADGNIFSSGAFTGTVDFDPGPSTYNLTASENYFENHYLLKLDASGNLLWVVQMNGVEVFGRKISVDINGSVYTTGKFRGTVDFNPGVGIFNINSVGDSDVFVSKLDSSGNFVWANNMDGVNAYSFGSDIWVDQNANVYTLGVFIGTIDFDPGSGFYNMTSMGASDMFVHKMSQCANSVTITTQPLNQLVCTGTNAIFSVTATGTTVYQWQLSTDGSSLFNDIIGANTSSYTVSSVTTTQNSYKYRCMVTGECNGVISSNAVLTVVTPVSITSQPADAELCSGNNASFSVSGSSMQTITYQWQVSTNGGTIFNTVTSGGVYSGATTSILLITGVTASLNHNRYRCQLSNATCSVATNSNTAILSVRQLPTIELSATPLTSLLPGQPITLTARPGASAGGILSATWFYNNAVVPNTGNTLKVNVEQTGTYQVRIQEAWQSGLVCSNQSAIIISDLPSKELFIFPNPNDGHFKVSYYNNGDVNTLQTVTVYDSKGARVYHSKFTNTGMYNLLNINLVPVASGFYSIVVADANNNTLAIGKIIVQ